MQLKDQILAKIRRKNQLRAADIVTATGFSRVYINRLMQELRNEGKIVMIGKANRAIYVPASRQAILKAKSKILKFRKELKNDNISEDLILDKIKQNSGIFISIKKNAEQILDYAFTEMLNNAIEHSQSANLSVEMKKSKSEIIFQVTDKGIGIFNNLMSKRHLKNELEAIQDLLKGKQTTAPEQHSGEGIFFTSKLADVFIIQSSQKKLIFNNLINDIFIQDVKYIPGTKVTFTLLLKTKKHTQDVFKKYTGSGYAFSQTQVAVRLYKMGSEYISRSQARRIVSGLEKFKTVTLDFVRIQTVGQAFADEIFRVWKNHHPSIKVIPLNANENITFMIKRAYNS